MSTAQARQFDSDWDRVHDTIISHRAEARFPIRDQSDAPTRAGHQTVGHSGTLKPSQEAALFV